MLKSLLRLNRILDPRARHQLVGLLLVSTLAAMFEFVGVGSVVPFVAIASKPTSVTSLPALAFVYHLLGFQTSRAFLIFWGLVMLITLAVVNLLTAVTIWLGCRFGKDLQLQLSGRLYRGYLAKPYEWHLSRHSATLSESLSRSRRLAETVYKPLVTFMARGFPSALLLIALIWLNPLATAVATAMFTAVFTGIYVRCRRNMRAISEAENVEGYHLAKGLSDCFGALKQVQMAGCEAHFVELHDQQLAVMGDFLMGRTWLSEIPRIALQGLTNMTILLLVVYLEATLRDPQFLIPLVSAYALAGYRMVPSLQLCLACALAVEASGPTLESLWNDLQDMPDLEPQPVPRPLTMEQTIALRSITYQYPQAAAPVLRDCSLEIPVGSKIGIVGPSGLGKTTLVNLLAGLLRPQQGTLERDEETVTPEMLRSWRRSIGYVPQDVFLTDDTLAANIALGSPRSEIDPKRLQQVAQKAALSSYIESLPDGFQTRVGERGIRLSGGQRQRLGLARALYHDPKLLLLDEATSALDSGTEAELMKTLEGLAGSVTIVLVAHRLSTVFDCDRIYVIGEGGIVARGSYSELAKESPDFQAIAPAGVA